MKTRKIFFLSFFFMLLFAACSEDFLNEELYSGMKVADFYKTEQDALAAVSALYNNLQIFGNEFWDQGLAWTYMTMTSTDVQNSGWNINEWDNYTFNSGHVYLLVMWRHVYNTNNKANAVIGRLPGITMNETLKSRLVAEAKFLRALNYFNAVRWWGDVPVILEETEEYSDIQDVSRTPQAQVFGQILKDLNEAIPVLPVSYASSDKGRVTKGAAKALLGKVYLTRGWNGGPSSIITADLQLAVDEFEDLMSAPYSYQLTSNLLDEWDYTKENNPALGYIFSAQYSKGLAFEGSWFAQNMEAGELQGGWWGFAAPETWIQGPGGFEITWVDGWNPVPVDKRLSLLWENYTTNWWMYWSKKWWYEEYLGWAEHPQNYPLIRYADILLMHSEALNELKAAPDAEVVASINLVRSRAGVAPYDPAAWTKATFREEIQNERNRELWGEGATWFDYVRKGMLVSRMTAAGTPNVASKHILFPVPQQELDNNPGLKPQNPGW